MWGGGELEEGGQKVETFSYKINEYDGGNVPHADCSYHCYVVYFIVAKRVDPKFLSQGKKHFFFLYPYKVMDVNQTYCGNHVTKYVSQVIMLYTGNL